MAQCQFCGGQDKSIHPDSGAQYGEPVCTDCYDVTPDPTNDVPRSRTQTFHDSHMLHRGYLEEQGEEEGSEPDYEGIMERRGEARGERTAEYWDRKF